MSLRYLSEIGLVCAIVICALPVRVDARWADPKEASIQVNYQNTSTSVDADGASTSVMETEIEVLNEHAKDLLSTQRFVYM
jgi:hypothetical protein